MWKVIPVGNREDGNFKKHFAIWNDHTGAVAGRFYNKEDAEAFLEDYKNKKVVANFNPKPPLNKYERTP